MVLAIHMFRLVARSSVAVAGKDWRGDSALGAMQSLRQQRCAAFRRMLGANKSMCSYRRSVA